MPYPSPYPPPPTTSSEPLKPSGWWYGIAGGIGAVGVILAVVVLVATFSSYSDKIDDFQRVEIPGSGVVTLDDTGGYTIYHEFPGADSSDRILSDLVITVTAPDGSEVDLDPYDSDVTYFTSDVDGVALYSFRAFETGDYEIDVRAEGGEFGDVAVGRGLGSALVGGIVGAIVLGLGGIVAGGVIAIVTGVRRSRNRHMRQLSRVGPQSPWAGPHARPPGSYGGWGPTPPTPPSAPGPQPPAAPAPPAPPAPPPPPPPPHQPSTERPSAQQPSANQPPPGQPSPAGQPSAEPAQPEPPSPAAQPSPDQAPADRPTPGQSAPERSSGEQPAPERPWSEP
jgi:hypothetical protein